jgi:hypothetical protein
MADGSTTTIIQPGPLIDFLIANQNVSNPFQIDWAKVQILFPPANSLYQVHVASYCMFSMIG